MNSWIIVEEIDFVSHCSNNKSTVRAYQNIYECERSTPMTEITN